MKVNFKYERECNTINFYNVVANLGGDVKGFVWDFGDGNFSNEENPTHTYADNGSYVVTLSVYMKHGDDCCTKVIEKKIGVKKCSPCELLEKLAIQKESDKLNVTLSSSLPNYPYLIHEWVFNDGTIEKGHSVTRPLNSIFTVVLNVYGFGLRKQCCEKSVYYKHGRTFEPIDIREPVDIKFPLDISFPK